MKILVLVEEASLKQEGMKNPMLHLFNRMHVNLSRFVARVNVFVFGRFGVQ